MRAQLRRAGADAIGRVRATRDERVPGRIAHARKVVQWGIAYAAGAVADTMEDVRSRDRERLDLQVVGGITAGRALMRGNLAAPEP